MRVLNERILHSYIRKHAAGCASIEAWLATVLQADWSSIDDVRKVYPSADGGVRCNSGNLVTVFNVGGNNHRIIASVLYPTRTIAIREVLTHQEYSKNLWKARC